jgi:hypothetical protein
MPIAHDDLETGSLPAVGDISDHYLQTSRVVHWQLKLVASMSVTFARIILLLVRYSVITTVCHLGGVKIIAQYHERCLPIYRSND